jgi:hypothetical protein
MDHKNKLDMRFIKNKIKYHTCSIVTKSVAVQESLAYKRRISAWLVVHWLADWLFESLTILKCKRDTPVGVEYVAGLLAGCWEMYPQALLLPLAQMTSDSVIKHCFKSK